MPLSRLLAPLALAFALPAWATEPVQLSTFVRAETDGYFASYAKGGLGVFTHERAPVAADGQTVIRMNRDTLYSSAILDLTAPATVTLPDAGDRFLSMIVINQDHYVKTVAYDAGDYTLTQDAMGTRYVAVLIRTFANPNDADDVKAANAVQDALAIRQDSVGTLDLPDWDQDQRKAVREALNALTQFMDGFDNAFGDEGKVDPVQHLIGTAAGWGGNPREAAIYVSGQIPVNDGKTAYTLTVGDVPVDGFWSITVYNKDGYFEAPAEQASLNDVTAQKGADGTVTVHFGGDASQPNFLRIMDGWGYVVRLYRPRQEILDGTWTFPALQPVQ